LESVADSIPAIRLGLQSLNDEWHGIRSSEAIKRGAKLKPSASTGGTGCKDISPYIKNIFTIYPERPPKTTGRCLRVRSRLCPEEHDVVFVAVLDDEFRISRSEKQILICHGSVIILLSATSLVEYLRLLEPRTRKRMDDRRAIDLRNIHTR